ncbi:MAG: hypothetical protein ABI151_04540, partial [Chitinophagaceae bacterium]
YDEVITPKSYSFISKSPINTNNSMRVLLPAKPSAIFLKTGAEEVQVKVDTAWDEASHTVYLGFDNKPEGTKVQINW